jgi:hypothetical protein
MLTFFRRSLFPVSGIGRFRREIISLQSLLAFGAVLIAYFDLDRPHFLSLHECAQSVRRINAEPLKPDLNCSSGLFLPLRLTPSHLINTLSEAA